MAIHSENNSAEVQTAGAPSFNPNPSRPIGQTVEAKQVNEAPWKFGDPRMTGPISYSQGSDNLLKLRDKMQDAFKDLNPSEIKAQVLVMDNQQISGIYYSSVILCMQMPNAKVNGVAFYTMLLASTREAPASKTETILGNTIEIKIVPGEAFDAVYVNQVTKVVADAFPNRQLFNVGGTIVPADFNAEDPNAIHRLVYNASSAVYAELRVRQPDFKDINLAAAKNDNNLQVNVVFGRETIENSASEPMRSDVDISFVAAQQGNTPDASLNNQARQASRFGKVVGFIDPVWAPVQVQQNYWGNFNPQMNAMMTQKYAARFVITHMESTQVPTLAAYLLLLLTTMPLGMNDTWYHTFYNASRFSDKKGGIDFTDIGALNIEANLPSAKHPNGNANGIGDRLDTRAKDFDQTAFGIYMKRLFRDGLVYSLDVPLCGPQTWYLEVFKAACDGNQDAYAHIVSAADYLTNGAFSQSFGANGTGRDIFAQRGDIIHLGYYEDSEGRKRDIRDIDHLAVVNAYGESDMNIVRTWSDSFLQLSRPVQMRLADRWKIISAITKNRAVLTGTAERVTFTDSFLQALSRAAQSAGLTVRTNVPSGSLQQIDRGVATFVNQALVPASFGAVFQQNGSPVGNGYTNYGTKQWGRYSY